MNLWESIASRLSLKFEGSLKPIPPVFGAKPNALENQSAELDLARALEFDDDTPESEEIFLDERTYIQENKQQAEEAISAHGFEAVAFYAPISIYGPTKWGIYYNEPLFYGLCGLLKDYCKKIEWNTIITETLRVMYRHEMFHAGTELFVLVLEDFSFLGIYHRKHEDKCLGDFPHNHYRLYFDEMYKPTFPSSECIEESLATAFQFQHKFKMASLKKAFASITEQAPPAYREWKKYSKQNTLSEGIHDLSNQIIIKCHSIASVAQRITQRGNGFVWFPKLSLVSLNSRGPVPCWVYRPDKVRPSRFTPSVLGSLRLRKLLTKLKKKYNAKIMSGGKHQKIVFPNGNKVPYKNKNRVPDYLVNDISKALGISRRQFLAECLNISV